MMIGNDPHSCFRRGHARTTHIQWTIEPDFGAQTLGNATAIHTFDKRGMTALDTWMLDICRVFDANTGDPISYTLGKHHPVKGSMLSFVVPVGKVVGIEYKTTSGAKGLQWFTPEQAGGMPFAYAQGEAISARSYIPCQDTPSVKARLDGDITVPEALCGLIAAPVHNGRVVENGKARESWSVPYPIPSYLIVFAAGDLASRDISPTMRVWGHLDIVDAAAYEFAPMTDFMKAGEALYGPYPYGRCDILVLPPMFPYGGMENLIIFVTPALLAGDRSSVGTIAHEMAHGWYGNHVTNADWQSFFINEGFTVAAENEIMEAVMGRDHAQLGLRLLQLEFEDDCERFKREGRYYLTALCSDISKLNPDSIFSRVSYFKSCQLLRLLKNLGGEERYNQILRTYIDRFGYGSISTAELLAFIREEFGDEVYETARVDEWVYKPGYPDNAPAISSPLIDEVEAFARKGELPPSQGNWVMPQWQLYLEMLPRPVTADFAAELDRTFGLSNFKNVEVRWSFLVLAARAGYGAVLPETEEFLYAFGRMKYAKPLYEALILSGRRDVAERIFAKARLAYHPVTASTVEEVFARTA